MPSVEMSPRLILDGRIGLCGAIIFRNTISSVESAYSLHAL